MTWDDFDAWAPRSVRDLAAGRVAAGLQETADADAFAEGLLLDLLPDGLATPLHHLWSVRCGSSDETVGHLWMRVRPLEREVEAYVLDVGIEPVVRGRGLGRATMLAAERAARDLAATVVRLTVLASNTPARRLYDSLGYTVAGLTATKRLAAPRTSTGTATAPRLRLSATTVAGAGRPAPTDLRRWTAYDGDDVVGGLSALLQHRTDGPHAWVDGFEVREDRRGRGLGRALAAAAERELLALGVRTVRVSVPATDVGARSLCASRGLTVAALELEKSLG
jgi:ribosomal protein S18 acetylase RimI-like enzyme